MKKYTKKFYNEGTLHKHLWGKYKNVFNGGNYIYYGNPAKDIHILSIVERYIF